MQDAVAQKRKIKVEQLTVELILQRDLDNRHQDTLDVEENVGRALKSKYKRADGLQHTERRDALVIEEVAIVILHIIPLLAVLQQLPDNAQVGITELLAQGHGERGEFGSKNLDEVLHDVGQSINIRFIGQLQELLHDGWDARLHACPDDVVPDERLQRQSRSHADGKLRVGHAVEDMAVYGEEIVLVLEVQLFEFLDGVASARTEESLLAGKIGENIAHKEVFHLVSNGRLLAQDDRRKRPDHAQGALLCDVVLTSFGRLLILVYYLADEREDAERLFPPHLGQRDQEIGGRNVWRRNLLVEVQLSVEVLFGFVLKPLNVLLGKAEDRKDEMRDKVGQVRLQVSPHILGLDALV